MTKPTGRPRGRPKTKEYVTLMARVPQDLAERIQRYAGRKRQTISEVLRDGLLVLLQDADPYHPFTSDTKEEEEEPPDAQPVIASDTKEALTYNMSDSNAEPEKASDKKEGEADLAPEAQEATPPIMSDTIEAFDPAKYMLGKLCPRGHDYHGAGQSLLRRSDRHCLACDREKFQERRQAKRT